MHYLGTDGAKGIWNPSCKLCSTSYKQYEKQLTDQDLPPNSFDPSLHIWYHIPDQLSFNFYFQKETMSAGLPIRRPSCHMIPTVQD